MRILDSRLAAYYQGFGPRPAAMPPEVARRLVMKLDALVVAESLNDLRIPPGNHLEKLVGNQSGRYSIRVTLKWRLVFTWGPEGATDVEFIDYH